MRLIVKYEEKLVQDVKRPPSYAVLAWIFVDFADFAERKTYIFADISVFIYMF